MTAARLTSSLGTDKRLFGTALLRLLSNVGEGEGGVQRQPHSPEATGRETACSNLLRAGTKYIDLQHEGCRICDAQRLILNKQRRGTGANELYM